MKSNDFNDFAKKAVVINVRMYEAAIDDATGKIHVLNKQVNNPVWCTDYTTRRHTDTSINSVIEALCEKSEDYKNADILLSYPFKPETDRDEKHSFLVIYGTQVKEQRPDYNKPIIVEGECTPESRANAIAEACKIVYHEKPFILFVPEETQAMYDITISYLPPDAISHFNHDPAKSDEDAE